jgi:ceramide synthetase
MPFLKCPRPVLVYALSTMGYHFEDGLMHAFFKERQSDFYEMLLHHMATVALYFCMIFGNGLSLGCVIAYLHDIADIFGCLVKFTTTMDAPTATLGVFVVMISSWFWTRLYVLPQIIYQIFTNDYVSSVALFYRLNGVFLGLLQFLHTYWFYMFLVMIRHKIKTGKTEDLQNQPIKKTENNVEKSNEPDQGSQAAAETETKKSKASKKEKKKDQ